MAKHKPGIIYCAHKIGTYPNAEIHTINKSAISFVVFYNKGTSGYAHTVTRKFARMFAHRINQCLDGTK